MKSETKGLLPSDELLSQLHSVHSNILSDFIFFLINLVPLISINMCHYNHLGNKINKKAGDVIGPWGKNTKTRQTILMQRKQTNKQEKNDGIFKKYPAFSHQRRLSELTDWCLTHLTMMRRMIFTQRWAQHCTNKAEGRKKPMKSICRTDHHLRVEPLTPGVQVQLGGAHSPSRARST